ncbi:class I SAM-dependent methyltransferase [Bradyrhizobium sp. ORS 111]|uniref:class I SAM-dependent methyltransferase n=1 Tax=Bradyrhizobium sp. ORS 111 TaxID=1685958 RepID=UPI00388F3472
MSYVETFGVQWNLHSKVQLDSFTGVPLSYNRLKAATHWPDDLTGDVIVEAGSGAGRFTEHLARTKATILTFDMSDAINANIKNNGHNNNVCFFSGDINDLPIPPGTIDKVLCLGVLQHTPDPKQSFMSLAKLLRPGGLIAIDVYPLWITALMHWKYVLRPITKRMDKDLLYRIIAKYTPPLVPVSIFLRRIAGRAGMRLLPIVQYDYFGISPEINREWAVLDTFDMYSPTYDNPQTMRTVRKWFEEAGMENVTVERGNNGIVARGQKK